MSESRDLDAAAAQAHGRIARASRRSDIGSFMVMDVMSAAARLEAAGMDVIHMEVGQPATAAPQAAREAAKRALDEETLGYTLALGTPALRQRIARHYRERHGVEVPASRVVVTTGSSAGFVLSFLALFDQGDRVALPSPGYPCYRQILSALGQQPELIETSAETRWMPVPEDLERLGPGLAGLLLASPNNPTGTMLQPERMEALAKYCEARGIWFLSDEIYHGLTFDQPATTALACSDNAIIINSFSKYFSMTGWRIGWLVLPEPLVPVVERLAQNFYICAPAVAQAAALGAFDGTDELDANVAVYAANRSVLLAGLPEAGFDKIIPADGAFYLYCDVSAFTDDSLAFSHDMLADIGVAATSGVDFDADRGRRYLRFSYAGATERMVEAVERLKGWHRLR